MSQSLYKHQEVGILHHSSVLRDEDTNISTMISICNTAATDAVGEKLGKKCRKIKDVGHQRCSRPL